MNGVPIPYGLGVLLGLGALVLSLLLVLFVSLISRAVQDEEHKAQLLNLSKVVLWLGVWLFMVAPIPDSVPTLMQLMIATVTTFAVLYVPKKVQRPRIEVRWRHHVVDSDNDWY